MSVRVLMVTAAALLPLLACGQANLVANPGFEQGAEPWGLVNDWYASGDAASPGVIDAEVVHTGDASLRIDGQGSRGLAIQAPLPVEGGERYRLSCWMRGADMGDVRAGPLVEFWDEDSGHLGGSFAAREVPPQWERVSEVVYAPPDADYAKVMCATQADNDGRVWFDDVGLRPAVPAPPVDASVADGALVWEDYEAPGSVAYYRVYASDRPFDSVALMVAAAWLPADATSVRLEAVDAPGARHVAIVAVDEDDMENPQVRSIEVTQ